MDIESDEQREKRQKEAIEYLEPFGFIHWFSFFFIKNGKTYDLSAADLNQIERVEREGLFVVDYDMTIGAI